MAGSVFLVSTLVTGVALLAVVWFTTRERQVRRELTARLRIASPTGGGGAPGVAISGAGIVAGLAAILLLGVGVTVGVAAEASALFLFVGALVGLVGVYLVWGVYHVARIRGLTFSQAVGFGAWFLGLLFLGGIVARLVLGG